MAMPIASSKSSCRASASRVDYVEGSDAEAVEAALPGARLLYLESPTSMVFELQDIARLTRAARAQGITTVMDNSWATPIFQKPITHGVDLVLHSASKYIGGHSDTVAGVVAGSKALIARINEFTHPFLGAKLSPLEAFLLDARLAHFALPPQAPYGKRAHRRRAPARPRHMSPRSIIRSIPIIRAARRLSGFTGLFTFEVDDAIDIPRFADLLKFFRLGVSWGGHESLVVPVAASLAQTPGINSFDRFDVSPRAIRLHVGLEDAEMLWADLENALAKSVKS